MPALPDFIPPMLARRAEPFDSDEFLFEIKWDGTRAQGRITDRGAVWTNRRRADLTDRYPELAGLGELGEGLLLDGEIVVLRDGKPDFRGMLSREQARGPQRAAALSRTAPATFVAFDLLFLRGESLLDAPLLERRAALHACLEPYSHLPGLLFSDGVVGAGRAFTEAAVAQQLEGVMAKRLTSTYLPGVRSADWLKIKRRLRIQCAILGFQLTGRELRSLIVATDVDGELRYVGKVGSGLDGATRTRLITLLQQRRRATPLVACEIDGLFVEPGLYCTVDYLEWTAAGHLRAPVFVELIVDDAPNGCDR
ncbi:MAG: ATP-dependent DNA ligase [Planctomycetes bacterium]|nr:ATP-dependent DNA ligase [Planctomycetota bacterium]MCB9870556.1 ATP-dependent DNA ligase [Planctomycetota bacterium]MCB9889724.1 ATP-dependent DNA ligase [Planctomycetota bacterium]